MKFIQVILAILFLLAIAIWVVLLLLTLFGAYEGPVAPAFWWALAFFIMDWLIGLGRKIGGIDPDPYGLNRSRKDYWGKF